MSAISSPTTRRHLAEGDAVYIHCCKLCLWRWLTPYIFALHVVIKNCFNVLICMTFAMYVSYLWLPSAITRCERQWRCTWVRTGRLRDIHWRLSMEALIVTIRATCHRIHFSKKNCLAIKSVSSKFIGVNWVLSQYFKRIMNYLVILSLNWNGFILRSFFDKLWSSVSFRGDFTLHVSLSIHVSQSVNYL